MKRHGGLWFPEDENLSAELRKQLDAPHGYHGDRLLEALEQVTDFSCAVDCGAHVGTWTRVLADRFEKVIAFEPDPDSAACLLANTGAFANVRVHEYALGDVPGDAALAKYKGNIGNFIAAGEGKPVLVGRLDNVGLERCGYMKIHANGYELRVLQGAVETIRRCKPVLTVVFKPKPETTARYGYGAEELAQFVLGLGYKPGRGQKPYRVFVPA